MALSSGNKARTGGSSLSGKLSGGAAAKSGVSGKGKSKVDLAKLFATMDGRSGGDRFKLDAKGTVRFRLVQPLGTDDVPMIPADEHWLPYVKDDGKEGKRQAYCYDLIGQPCPFCILSGLLQNSKVAALEEMGKDIRPSRRWLMYVVNRSYMMTQDDPHVVESMEKIEKAPLPQTVAQALVQLMRNRSWGDPTDPTNGYDVEVTGKPRGGNVSFTEYSLSPVPRDASPAYDLKMAANFQPLSSLLEFKSDEDCMKLIEPILATLATEGFEEIVEAFWEAMEAAPDGEVLGEEAEEVGTGDAEEGTGEDENYGASVRPEMADEGEGEGEDIGEDGEDAGEDAGEEGGEDEGDGSDAGADDAGDSGSDENLPPAPAPVLRRPAPGAPQPEAGKRRTGAAVTMARTTAAKAQTAAAPAPAASATAPKEASAAGGRGSKLLEQLRRNKK